MNQILKSLKAPLKLIQTYQSSIRLNLKPKLITVDFSGNRIKIVHGQRISGKIVVEGVSCKKIEKGSDAEVQDYVKNYFKEKKIIANQVTCVIPSKLFIAKNVEIPSTERDEIAKIIDLQVGRLTPYSREEIVIDFLTRETPTQHYTSVLLIIVNRQLADRYWRIFEPLGIPIKISIASEFLGLTFFDLAKKEGDSGIVSGIHISEDASDFIVMEGHQMIFVRSLPIGAEHFRADRQLSASEFINELNKSLGAYQDQEAGKPIEQLVITGVLDDSEWLKELVQTSCPALQQANASINIMDYRSYFQMADGAFKQIGLDAQISYFEPMASLVHAEQTKIDLLPRDAKMKMDVREQSKDILSLGISIMTIFLMTSLFLATKTYFKTAKLQKLENSYHGTFDEARVLDRISTKNRVVRKILKNRGRGLHVFDSVGSLLGDSVYLSNFSYDDGKKITLTGTAESMSQVYTLVTRLQESNYFENVTTKETKTKSEGKIEVTDFVLEGTLAEGV